jgi:hypothetical protein
LWGLGVIIVRFCAATIIGRLKSEFFYAQADLLNGKDAMLYFMAITVRFVVIL